MARSFMTRRKSERVASASAVNEADIAKVAYELFERRGRQHGYDQQDWFEAQQILQQRRASNGKSR